MKFYFYAAVTILAVVFAHFLIGSLKRILLRNLFLFFFVRRHLLEYSSSDESDESDEEESNKLAFLYYFLRQSIISALV